MKIAIDMDGVLCDFTTPAIEIANELYDLNLTMEDMKFPYFAKYVWERINNKEKERYNNEEHAIYRMVCSRGFFAKLKPFEHAIEGVQQIADANHEIIFATKPLEWRHCSQEKVLWLKRYFPKLDYSLVMVNRMETKALLDVDVIIEDDPRILELVYGPKFSIIPICIEREWNKSTRNKFTLRTASNMLEAAEHIKNLERLYGKPELEF